MNGTSASVVVDVNSTAVEEPQKEQIEWGKDPNNAFKQCHVDLLLMAITFVTYCISM